MSAGPESGYVRLGDSAAVRCVGGQTQYNSRYLTGLDRVDLSEGLDWVDDPGGNYHGILINPVHACILAARIRQHRIEQGVISAEDAPTIPCEECLFADEVTEHAGKI